MSGIVKSAKGFLGTDSGPGGGPTVDTSNLDQLTNENSFAGYNQFMDPTTQYGAGKASLDDTIKQIQDSVRGSGADWHQKAMGAENNLATGALTGSRFAADQVASNPAYAGLFGPGGQLQNTEDLITKEQNQGFKLQPEDYDLYGQESGNIARMFGSQGNQISQDLANRGLASAPSGAAGAMFSGLAGNQNEQLERAQQQIAQARFQNTQNQIAQNQNFAAQLGGQYNTALNNQYNRQLAGAQTHTGNLTAAQGEANNVNQLNQAQFQQGIKNQPMNAFDMLSGTALVGAASGSKQAGSNAGNSMFNNYSTAKTPAAKVATAGEG